MYNPILPTKTRHILVLLMCTISSFNAVCQSTSKFMRANLYMVPATGSKVLVDGNYTQYDNNYSNAVDIQDVWKMTNTGENFGIIRDGYTLVMERRKEIPLTDTSFFRIWNLQPRNYQVEIIARNLNQPDLQGSLWDNFTRTYTDILLNDTTRINFTISSDPASYVSNRFRIEYSTVYISSLPVIFSSINAYRKGAGAVINWKIALESDVDYYSVERASNGNNFVEITRQEAFNDGNSQNYSYYERNLSRGNHVYRIKAVYRDGNYAYSEHARTMMNSQNAETITVYPNPVINKKVQIQFSNTETMKCRIAFINSNGKEVWSESAVVPAGANRTVQLPQHITSGVYRCILWDATGIKDAKTIIVL